MGLDLFNKQVLDTYDAIIKVGDNNTLTGTPKLLSDGRGNDTPIYLGTSSMGIGITPDSGIAFQVNGGSKFTNITVTGQVTDGLVINGETLTTTLQFAGGTGDQGTMSWNADEETVDLIQNGTTLQIGQEMHYNVKNQTGSDIPDGTAVQAVGTLGASGRILIAPMDASSSGDPSRYLGVTTETIADGENGKVTSFGKVRGIDTTGSSVGETWVNGTILWLDPENDGGFTMTQPEAPNLKIATAYVIYASATVGTIFVRANAGIDLHNNHRVQVSSLADKDLLVWNDTLTRWENSKTLGNITTGTISSGNITTTGYLRGPASFVIDPAAHGDDTGEVVIAGNLRVDGVTTTVNSDTVTVKDKNIVLGSGAEEDTDNDGAGITVLRPTTGSNDTYIQWNETDDQWEFNNDVSIESNQPNLYLKELDATSEGRIVQSGGILNIQSSGENYTGAGGIKFAAKSNSVVYGQFDTSGNLSVTGTVTATGGSSTNWNTAYSYSQVGHLPLTGGTVAGIITLSRTQPKLQFAETDQTDKNFEIRINGGDFIIEKIDDNFSTNRIERFRIDSDGLSSFKNDVTVTKTITTNGIHYPLTLEVTDTDANVVDQVAGDGVGVQFKLAQNTGGSFLGGSIAAVKENGPDADSSTSLEFYTSNNDETLDKQITISSGGHLNIINGDLQINGTSIIDSSRNISAVNGSFSGNLGQGVIFTESGQYEVGISNGTGGQLWLTTEDGVTTVEQQVRRFVITGNTATPYYYWYHGNVGAETVQMQLSQSGNLLVYNKLAVGQTSDPSYQLSVNGTSYFSDTVEIIKNGIGLQVENSSTSGADTGILIRGARNGQSYGNDNLTSYILLANHDSDETVLLEDYNLAKIGAGMYAADDNTGFLQFLTNNGSGLVKALDIKANQNSEFYGNVNISNNGLFQIADTTVIDASRNLTNIGAGSFSGDVTFADGKGIVSASGAKIVTGTGGLTFQVYGGGATSDFIVRNSAGSIILDIDSDGGYTNLETNFNVTGSASISSDLSASNATFSGDLDVNGTGVTNFAGDVTVEGTFTMNGASLVYNDMTFNDSGVIIATSTTATRGIIWDVGTSGFLSKIDGGGANGGMLEIYTNMDDAITTGDVFRVKEGSVASTLLSITGSGKATFSGQVLADTLELTSGSAHLTFTESGSDWFITNNYAGYNNGISIYNGTGGVDIVYDEATIAEFDTNGVTFHQNTTINGTLSATGYNDSNWNTAYTFANTFDITDYTDPKYLRADTGVADTAESTLTFNGAVTFNNGPFVNAVSNALYFDRDASERNAIIFRKSGTEEWDLWHRDNAVLDWVSDANGTFKVSSKFETTGYAGINGASSTAYPLNVTGSINTDTDYRVDGVAVITTTRGGTFADDVNLGANNVTNVNTLVLNNTEGESHGTVSGTLMFDENFYADTEYGSTSTWNSNGGGLVIYNEDGWGRVVTDKNMGWLNAQFNTVLISHTAPTLDFVDTNSFTDTNDRFRIRAAGDVGVIRWWDNSAGTDTTLVTFNPNGDVDILGDVSAVDGIFSGSVGIGTVSPTETLDVRGSVKIGKDGVSPYLTFDEVPDSTSGSEFYLTHDISGNILKFTDDNSNDFIAMDRDNGLVGIGTTSPSAKLHVNSTDGQILLTGDNSMSMFQDSAWESSILFGAKHDGTNQVYGAGGRGAFKIVARHDGDASDQYLAFYGANAGTDGGTISWNTVGFAQDEDGNVGIGNIAPSQKLEVTGNAVVTGNMYVGQYIYHDGDTNSYLRFPAGDDFHLVVGGRVVLDIDEGGDPDILKIMNDRVRVYAGSGGSGDTADGVLHAMSDVIGFSTYTTSDQKYKENVKTIENPLEIVSKLNGVTFDWKKDGKKSLGYIAQEVEEVLPEMVKEVPSFEKGETYKTVNYAPIVAVMGEAIKEQQSQIDSLKEQIEELKKLIK